MPHPSLAVQPGNDASPAPNFPASMRIGRVMLLLVICKCMRFVHCIFPYKEGWLTIFFGHFLQHTVSPTSMLS